MAFVGRQIAALQEFLRSETAGGWVLIAASAAALIWSNSALAPSYHAFVELGIDLGSSFLPATVHVLVNESLMAVFFLLVGLEIKREFLEGALSSRRGAALPLIAAAGGMAAPALLYILVTRGHPEAARGWAIPAATDIAFALSALSVLGRRIPASLKIFLAALAIVDDLGAITIIAFFYTDALSAMALGLAAAALILLLALNRARISALWPYLLVGFFLWGFLLRSGIHATLAGVLLAFAIPLFTAGREGPSPLMRLEHRLQPYVAYIVLPVFGLTNAGLSFAGFDWSMLLDPVPLGIAVGLLAGKTAGVFGAAWGAIRLGLAAMPRQAGFASLFGVALLCGIGFTMSLLLAALAFDDPAREQAAKLGVFAGSLLSAALGLIWLSLVSRAEPPPSAAEASDLDL